MGKIYLMGSALFLVLRALPSAVNSGTGECTVYFIIFAFAEYWSTHTHIDKTTTKMPSWYMILCMMAPTFLSIGMHLHFSVLTNHHRKRIYGELLSIRQILWKPPPQVSIPLQKQNLQMLGMRITWKSDSMTDNLSCPPVLFLLNQDPLRFKWLEAIFTQNQGKVLRHGHVWCQANVTNERDHSKPCPCSSFPGRTGFSIGAVQCGRVQTRPSVAAWCPPIAKWGWGQPLTCQFMAWESGGCRAGCLAALLLVCPWFAKDDGERLVHRQAREAEQAVTLITLAIWHRQQM